MITVRNFWTIVFITIALSFSLLAYADTYWLKGNKVKDMVKFEDRKITAYKLKTADAM